MKKIIGTSTIDINEAKKLYKEAFNDSNQFIDLYFEQYSKNNKYYFWKKDNEIVFMACVNTKRVYINNEKKTAGFIVAVATKKQFQKQGIMKSVFQSWLDEISFLYEYIFIQAYNWNVYKSYDFNVCTYKNEYTLRHDQYLKPSEYYQTVDYDKLNEIYNNFIKINKIKNFSYKTTKETQLYYKMLMSANDKIYMNKHAYVVISNNVINDFAYTDQKEFIKLLSNFKETKPTIKSYIDFDKRYFSLLTEKNIDCKVYQKTDLDILFNEVF